MVEAHYVGLFEGLDREISEQLGTMREQRKAASERLRPVRDAGPLRDRDGTEESQSGVRAADLQFDW
jgi:hypothetical protein